MKTITLLNSKGGVGKTMLATHIAAGLARRGVRVLLVDADGQANATTAFGHSKRPAFYDLIVRDIDWYGAVTLVDQDKYAVDVKGAPSPVMSGSLHLVPGNHETPAIPQHIEDETKIATRLQEVNEIFDVCIIDTSPTASLLHSAIHAATDWLLIPTQLEADSALDGTRASIKRAINIRKRAERHGLDICKVMGIVPNLCRPRVSLHAEMYNQLQEQYPRWLWEAISQRVVYAEAKLISTTIYAHPDAGYGQPQAIAEIEGTVDRVCQKLGILQHG